MSVEYRRELHGIADIKPVAARIQQHAGIANLAAGFGIKGRAIEDHHPLVAGRTASTGLPSFTRATIAASVSRVS